jgi:hypothetical protein
MAISLDSMGMTSPRSSAAPKNSTAAILAILAAGVAGLLAPYANEKMTVAIAAGAFPILLMILLHLADFQVLQLGPRLLLVLVVLRPLVDFSPSFQTLSAGIALKSSGFSLQDGFAAVFLILLAVVWLMGEPADGYRKLPNVLLISLVTLSAISWMVGGIGGGSRGFVRTAWGVTVALLFGSLLRTERQIDTFVRAVFYSSGLFLLVLLFNLDRGLTYGTEFRLGGQYETPSALSGVALCFFLYGLYASARARTTTSKFMSLLLLLLLAAVIIATQSRTPAIVMLVATGCWLWTSGRRRLLFGVLLPLLVFLAASTAASSYRLVASFSPEGAQANETLFTLTGRIALWYDWLQTYADASWFHKIFGIGWGVMLQKFIDMRLFGSSVTESSFMWFLIGTGALGFLAFTTYLCWVLLKAWTAWRKASTKFERQFALLTLLTAVSFVIEAFTTDVASAPNAVLYLYGVLSIFVFQWLGKRDNKVPGQSPSRIQEYWRVEDE